MGADSEARLVYPMLQPRVDHDPPNTEYYPWNIPKNFHKLNRRFVVVYVIYIIEKICRDSRTKDKWGSQWLTPNGDYAVSASG